MQPPHLPGDLRAIPLADLDERLSRYRLQSRPADQLMAKSLQQYGQLPMGNQSEALQAAEDASLTSVELRGVVELLLSSSTQEQRQLVLSDPRDALRRADNRFVHIWDPRLSTGGNRVARHLAQLLDGLARMDSWLRYRGRGELRACDRDVLTSGFERLARETRQVAEAADDFLEELRLP